MLKIRDGRCYILFYIKNVHFLGVFRLFVAVFFTVGRPRRDANVNHTRLRSNTAAISWPIVRRATNASPHPEAPRLVAVRPRRVDPVTETSRMRPRRRDLCGRFPYPKSYPGTPVLRVETLGRRSDFRTHTRTNTRRTGRLRRVTRIDYDRRGVDDTARGTTRRSPGRPTYVTNRQRTVVVKDG